MVYLSSNQIKEQMNMLEKGVFHIGVGTPGRIKALVEQGRRKMRILSTGYPTLDLRGSET